VDSQFRYSRDIQQRGYKKRPVAYSSRAGFDMVSISVPKPKPQPITKIAQPTTHATVPSTNASIPNSATTTKQKKSKKKPILFSLIAVIATTAILSNVFYIYTNNKIQSGTVTQVLGSTAGNSDESVTNSSGDVDETDVPSDTVNSYIVAPTLPRTITIDSIDVYARVIRVGIDSTNEIQAPRSIYNAGWYEGSNKPNEPGAVFIDGHVSGPTKKGIFYNLKKVAIGDTVTIEVGSGEKYTYKVEEKEFVKPQDFDINKALRSYNPDKQGLNIMTCTGEYNQNSKEYEERLVVYATRI
jgi:LPXTG-site transpeptidase (sortase) family protein